MLSEVGQPGQPDSKSYREYICKVHAAGRNPSLKSKRDMGALQCHASNG